jgi:hypothetical protein
MAKPTVAPGSVTVGAKNVEFTLKKVVPPWKTWSPINTSMFIKDLDVH